MGVIADSAVTITPIGSAVESPPSPLAPDLVATFERVTDTGAHGMNERIPVQAFYEGLEFMYRLVRAVTDGQAGV